MTELAEMDVCDGVDELTLSAGLRRQGVDAIDVVAVGCGMIDPPMTVVRLRVGDAGPGKHR